MLSTVTSKTSERVLSFLFAHTCALSVMMLSQLSTCSSGGAHQQHKQRGINIYDSISRKLDPQLSPQLKMLCCDLFKASAWDPVNGERKAVILNGTLISPCVMLPCRYQRRSLPGSAISHR
ncbi:hypothetical protein MHYP_G00137920 [Metynnis hypsauchen]